MKKDSNRIQLINALSAGDVKKVRAMKRQLPFFTVFTDEKGEYSFSIPYTGGEGNRDQRTGKGNWEQSLTRDENERLNNSIEIVCFEISVRS